jgi:hypothetical protein
MDLDSEADGSSRRILLRGRAVLQREIDTKGPGRLQRKIKQRNKKK